VAAGYARSAAGYATQDLPWAVVGTGCRVRDHRYRVRREGVGYAILVTPSIWPGETARTVTGYAAKGTGYARKGAGYAKSLQGTRDSYRVRPAEPRPPPLPGAIRGTWGGPGSSI